MSTRNYFTKFSKRRTATYWATVVTTTREYFHKNPRTNIQYEDMCNLKTQRGRRVVCVCASNKPGIYDVCVELWPTSFESLKWWESNWDAWRVRALKTYYYFVFFPILLISLVRQRLKFSTSMLDQVLVLSHLMASEVINSTSIINKMGILCSFNNVVYKSS